MTALLQDAGLPAAQPVLCGDSTKAGISPGDKSEFICYNYHTHTFEPPHLEQQRHFTDIPDTPFCIDAAIFNESTYRSFNAEDTKQAKQMIAMAKPIMLATRVPATLSRSSCITNPAWATVARAYLALQELHLRTWAKGKPLEGELLQAYRLALPPKAATEYTIPLQDRDTLLKSAAKQAKYHAAKPLPKKPTQPFRASPTPNRPQPSQQPGPQVLAALNTLNARPSGTAPTNPTTRHCTFCGMHNHEFTTCRTLHKTMRQSESNRRGPATQPTHQNPEPTDGAAPRH